MPPFIPLSPSIAAAAFCVMVADDEPDNLSSSYFNLRGLVQRISIKFFIFSSLANHFKVGWVGATLPSNTAVILPLRLLAVVLPEELSALTPILPIPPIFPPKFAERLDDVDSCVDSLISMVQDFAPKE